MKTLGIYLFDDVEVLDFAGPFEVFSVAAQLSRDPLHRVLTFSDDGSSIHAVNGLSVNSDLPIFSVEKLDYLVIPGGQGSNEVIKKEIILKRLDHLIASSEWTMSVCSGSRILAALNHLDQSPYCTHHSVYEDLIKLIPSGKPQPDKRFVQSTDRIYTAAGISAGIDLALELVAKTWGKELAEETAKYMEYQPYFVKA